MKEMLEKLTPEEKMLIFEEIKDAMNRGYSLGYIDGINRLEGRPQSSSSNDAVKFHLERVKEFYNI